MGWLWKLMSICSKKADLCILINSEYLMHKFKYSLLIVPCQAQAVHQPSHHCIPLLLLEK